MYLFTDWNVNVIKDTRLTYRQFIQTFDVRSSIKQWSFHSLRTYSPVGTKRQTTHSKNKITELSTTLEDSIDTYLVPFNTYCTLSWVLIHTSHTHLHVICEWWSITSTSGNQPPHSLKMYEHSALCTIICWKGLGMCQ